MAFRAILESVQPRPANLDYLVVVVYTDDVSTKVRVEHITAAPSEGWLASVVAAKLEELERGSSGVKEITALVGSDVAPAAPPESTDDEKAFKAYKAAEFAYLRGKEKVDAGFVAPDAKEFSALRDALLALYRPEYIGL